MKRCLTILILLLSLSSCDFQSREDFEKEIKNKATEPKDFEMPEITYIEEGTARPNKAPSRDEDDRDLADIYGEEAVGTNLNPAENIGSLLETDLGESQIEVSLAPSIQKPGGYSTILSYNRNDGLIEREFGPVAGFASMSTVVAYDYIDSESGPMLLVSQISVSDTESYSAYYLFNRYMSILDSLIFRNATEQVMPTVERLGKVVEYTDMAYGGDINEAIKNRMETEEKYLATLFDVYGVKARPVEALVDGREMEIGYIPDMAKEDRLLLVKTSNNPISPGQYIDILSPEADKTKKE